jgi:hypothetical protein
MHTALKGSYGALEKALFTAKAFVVSHEDI